MTPFLTVDSGTRAPRRPATSPITFHPLEGENKPIGSSSYVVRGETSTYQWSGSASLSIKIAPRGTVQFAAGGGIHQVTDSSYLVLNGNQHYRVWIDSREPSEGFSIFFRPGLVENVRRMLQKRNRGEIDERTEGSLNDGGFYERLYTDQNMLRRIHKFRAMFEPMHHDRLWAQEQLEGMALQLLQTQKIGEEECARLSAARESTRDEVYRRLCKARDYAVAMLHTRVTLDDMANVACFSPSYLLRVFKEVYGTTPHQFLTAERIERSKRLLLESDLAVTEVCHQVGFESLGSFSWLFRRRVGLSPEQFRRASA